MSEEKYEPITFAEVAAKHKIGIVKQSEGILSEGDSYHVEGMGILLDVQLINENGWFEATYFLNRIPAPDMGVANILAQLRRDLVPDGLTYEKWVNWWIGEINRSPLRMEKVFMDKYVFSRRLEVWLGDALDDWNRAEPIRAEVDEPK